MHLQAVVVHVSFDARVRLKFEKLGDVDRTRYLTVHDQMRDADFSFDASLFAQHQRRRFIRDRGHVADYLSVDSQASGEIHVALDLRPHSDQAVDSVLRLARLLAKHSYPCLLRKVDVLAGASFARSVFKYARLYRTHFCSRRNPKCSFDSAKILEVELEGCVSRVTRVRE